MISLYDIMIQKKIDKLLETGWFIPLITNRIIRKIKNENTEND